MNWDAVSAIADALATVGVIASLIYVAVQVRQNSKLIDQSILATRSEIVHDTSVSYCRFFELLAEDADLADIYRRGTSGEELNQNEAIRFESLIEIYMAWLEDVDHQYKSDLYFDEGDDYDLVEFMAPAYKSLLLSPAGRAWWNRVAQHTSTPSLYAKISKIIAQWDAEHV
jgi:hypothetical protein